MKLSIRLLLAKIKLWDETDTDGQVLVEEVMPLSFFFYFEYISQIKKLDGINAPETFDVVIAETLFA